MTNQTSSNKYSDRIAGLETDIANTVALKDQLDALGNNKKASQLLSANAQTKQGTELLKKVLISDDATVNQGQPQSPQNNMGSNSPQNNMGNQPQGSNSPQNNMGSNSPQNNMGNQPQGSQSSSGQQSGSQSQGSQSGMGSQYSSGSQGASGSQSSQGNMGTQGASGNADSQSSSGTRGASDTSAQGSQGQPTSNGTQGASNNTASQGNAGSQMPTGTQGASDSTSPQGNGSPQTKSRLQSLASELSNLLNGSQGGSQGSQGTSDGSQSGQQGSQGTQGDSQSGQQGSSQGTSGSSQGGQQGSSQDTSGDSQGSQGTQGTSGDSQGSQGTQSSQGTGNNTSGDEGTDQSQNSLDNKLGAAQQKLNEQIQSKQNPNKQTVEGEITVNGERHKVKLQRDITTEVKGTDEHARKEARNKVNNILAKADQKMRIEASKGNKNAGAGGAQLARDAQIINASETNWKVILEKFCKQYSKALYSPTHYNRSVAAGAGAYVPGRIKQKQKDNYVPGIEILVDTSGSVSDADLNYYIGVIASIFKKYKVTGEMIYWSVGIDNLGEFNDMVSLREINPASKGGTDIIPVFDYLMGRETFTGKDGKEHKCKTKPKEMNLILVFTDGCFSWDFDDSVISAFKHKIYWLAYPSDSKYIYEEVEAHKGFGNVAQIHREADR